MADDFLDEARRNWRAQDAEIEGVTARLRRDLAFQRLMQGGEFVAAVIAVAAGVGFAWMGVVQGDARLIVAAAVLLVLLPLLTWAAWRVRRQEPRWAEDEPVGVVEHMLARVEATRRLMSLALWQAWTLVGTVAAMWAVTLFGRGAVDAGLWIVTAALLASAAAAAGWAVWRERGLKRERANCERLLEELRRD
ncbi:hypothetical protein [Caulobacter sp. 17J65-9]|uniref:hypothetical protein n=1 Tax=Caulobacter sp. 17J65-9 TaxID=2709382 RepID=UPI0013CA9F25|nr:hypothetical protein [Caulobacter sp. 17J65-9]NEX92403.1 hypothetical protein [Caulobacter sp. 17J65-9]